MEKNIIFNNNLVINDFEENINENIIHIRVNQRNARKVITTIQGELNIDNKKFISKCKKKFACNGSIVNDKEYGEVLQFQGDQRNKLYEYLVELNIIDANNIKIH